jgi:hypothetical protein
MLKRSRKSHRDLNEMAASIVNMETEASPEPDTPSTKNPAAVALGRLGGKKGGPARAARLTSEQRRAIARGAAAARWGKA